MRKVAPGPFFHNSTVFTVVIFFFLNPLKRPFLHSPIAFTHVNSPVDFKVTSCIRKKLFEC